MEHWLTKHPVYVVQHIKCIFINMRVVWQAAYTSTLLSKYPITISRDSSSLKCWACRKKCFWLSMGDMANGFIDGLFDGLLRVKTKKTSKPRLTDAGWHDNAVVHYQNDLRWNDNQTNKDENLNAEIPILLSLLLPLPIWWFAIIYRSQWENKTGRTTFGHVTQQLLDRMESYTGSCILSEVYRCLLLQMRFRHLVI